MSKMRAKMQVASVQGFTDGNGVKTQENLSMTAVCANTYPEDGTDENNTFAKFTPTANLQIYICNPVLFGAFKVGEKYYVDFTEAP